MEEKEEYDPHEVNVFLYRKDGHGYGIHYQDFDTTAALKAIKSWSLNPELNFDYDDYVKLAKQIIDKTRITFERFGPRNLPPGVLKDISFVLENEDLFVGFN